MAFVITEACVDKLDGACVAVCPVDCIYEGIRARYINPSECIDCGACETACPFQAIYNEHDVPNELKVFVADNARFFTEPLADGMSAIGTPKGAKSLGRVGFDTPLVTALPLNSAKVE
jgi:NAD-dependent dihydropyrimidine dehydrogenase PreA subunit